MLDKLGGKWKCVILRWVMDRPRRFSELLGKMPGAAPKMLTQQLRDLEREEFLTRRVLPGVAPRVEYSATPLALSLRPVLRATHQWSSLHLLGRISLNGERPEAG